MEDISVAFQAYVRTLQDKLKELRTLILLKRASQGEEGARIMVEYKSELDKVERDFMYLKDVLFEEKQQIAEAKQMVKVLWRESERARYVVSFVENLQNGAQGSMDNEEVFSDVLQESTAAKANRNVPVLEKGEDMKMKRKLDKPSSSEFDKVPRYMRGRLNLAKLHSAVDIVNSTLEAKRKVLAMRPRDRSAKYKQAVLEWRQQETTETEGLEFVNETNLLATAKEAKVDNNTMKSALQSLRHIGYLRLITGGGVSRFVVRK